MRAQILLAREDIFAALDDTSKAVEFGRRSELTPWEAAAGALVSDRFSRAIELYAVMGARAHEAEARLLAAKHTADDDAVARENLERALAFYRSVRAKPQIREAEELLRDWASAAS